MELIRDHQPYLYLFESSTSSATMHLDHEREEDTLIPKNNYDLTNKLNLYYQWEEDLTKDLFTEITDDYEKILIIQSFATKLLENLVDLNPKYKRLVSKHFWDLV